MADAGEIHKEVVIVSRSGDYSAYDANIHREYDIADAELWIAKACMLGAVLPIADGEEVDCTTWRYIVLYNHPNGTQMRIVADWPGVVAKIFVEGYTRITTE